MKWFSSFLNGGDYVSTNSKRWIEMDQYCGSLWYQQTMNCLPVVWCYIVLCSNLWLISLFCFLLKITKFLKFLCAALSQTNTNQPEHCHIVTSKHNSFCYNAAFCWDDYTYINYIHTHTYKVSDFMKSNKRKDQDFIILKSLNS